MENKYEIIIIGAGLSGSTLGYLLRQQGRKVLIVEKSKAEDKDKLCGGLLTVKSVELLKSIFNVSDICGLIQRGSEDVIMRNKGMDLVVSNLEYYTVYRKNLDKYILNQYLEIGGELLDKATFEKVNADEKTITIDGNIYHYDYLVGSDGVFSPLRQYLTGKKPNKAFSLEMYSDAEYLQNRQTILSFSDKFKGYSWIIPNKDNVAVGTAGMDEKQTVAINDRHLDEVGIEPIKKRGAYLPTGTSILLNIGDNIFFTGDSAGLIAPITGEGIYYALFSAKVLSETLDSNYMLKLQHVRKRIRQELFLNRFVYNYRLRNYLFSKYYTNKFFHRKINSFARFVLEHRLL